MAPPELNSSGVARPSTPPNRSINPRPISTTSARVRPRRRAATGRRRAVSEVSFRSLSNAPPIRPPRRRNIADQSAIRHRLLLGVWLQVERNMRSMSSIQDLMMINPSNTEGGPARRVEGPGDLIMPSTLRVGGPRVNLYSDQDEAIVNGDLGQRMRQLCIESNGPERFPLHDPFPSHHWTISSLNHTGLEPPRQAREVDAPLMVSGKHETGADKGS
ncbi:hypothetical protein F53441_14510 [Fusarium austroafricanum]|uniref:Uncharacterized protein n=1 Tax=Fusarium austroafricanum TaxID=2364996 RepID=A0A8H4JBX5_9HYPO|nr:hypothetical protein F53441_14510 [Fusarium austroafricanum]